MLAQVKKLAGDDFAGRFGAWWSGRDYVPPAPDAEGEAKADAPAAKPEAPEPQPSQGGIWLPLLASAAVGFFLVSLLLLFFLLHSH